MPANWQGTCKWYTGAVPARTSTFTTAMRVLKRFRGWSVCVGMRSASTDWNWARDDYLYYHHHEATPHHTQFTSYPSTPARCSNMSPSAAACGAAPPVWSLLRRPHCCLRHSAVRGPVSGVVLRQTDSQSNEDRQCSEAAC